MEGVGGKRLILNFSRPSILTVSDSLPFIASTPYLFRWGLRFRNSDTILERDRVLRLVSWKEVAED